MAVKPKLRWAILHRDNFACRYCGRTAQSGVVLEVDHLEPRSRGGKDIAGNLVTACENCNSGKSDRPLSIPPVEDVSEDAFRRACDERGIIQPPPHASSAESNIPASDDEISGRLSFAYQVLGKIDEWDERYCYGRAREAAGDYEPAEHELDLCAASIALEAVFDERERLRDIVLAFLRAVPGGWDAWFQAVRRVKAEKKPPFPAIDVVEEALDLVLSATPRTEA